MTNAMMTRKIVRIDEDKCNGCGQCVPSCAEGAIRIVDGKAKLEADKLCDGLGNCLGTCPMDAITIEERTAEAFDEEAVERHLAGGATRKETAKPQAAKPQAAGGGCPGTMARRLAAAAEAPTDAKPPETDAKPQAARPSRLGHWPVQLALVPTGGAIWQDADVLIAADCVPTALPDFHERLLAGKTLAIACPKLDDLGSYIQKLAAIFAGNPIRSITVAHMEVPCCTGIVYAVEQALKQAGRQDIPMTDVTVGVDGTLRGGSGL